jgi:DNA processing protein
MEGLDKILNEKAKRECLFHLALINEKRVDWKSEKADNALRLLLNEHKSFEKIYQRMAPLFADPAAIAQGLNPKILSYIANTNFSLSTVADENFPERLRVEGTPVLYVQGNADYLRQPSIAVIGSRSLEEQGDFHDIFWKSKCALESIVKEGKVVVSGLAKGCDTLAHSRTMEFGGKTLGVLGVGLSQYYPKENKVLQDKMAETQCVVSQYPVGCDTYDRGGRAFVHRDLTQALLSDEVFVILASDKSGTMHAVNRALKQGKKVYALDVNFRRNFDWVKKEGVMKYETSSD